MTSQFIMAAVDASAQTGIYNLLGLLISSITAVAVAWIGFKMRQLEKNTNGMNEKLNKAVAGENLAIGKAQGTAEAEAKAATIRLTTAETKLAMDGEKQNVLNRREEKVVATAVGSANTATIKTQLQNIEVVGEDTQERVKKIEGEIIK